MSLRLLLIAERPEYRLLVKKHVEIEWPDAAVVEHRLGEDEPLEANFAAAGFDAAIIVAAPPTAAAERLAAGARGKTGVRAAGAVAARGCAGASARRSRAECTGCMGAKSTATSSSRRSPTHRASTGRRWPSLRSQPDFEQRYKFGAVIIRGHRCIRQVGSGGMCKIYLAESERAGSLVVLKVFSQVPDVSERIVGFDRFLQEYEIVAGLEAPQHRAHLRSGRRGRSRLYRHGALPGRRFAAAHEGAARARHRAALSRADRERARGHSCGGRAAPGLEAGQRHAAHRRIAVLDRFRPGEGQRARRWN